MPRKIGTVKLEINLFNCSETSHWCVVHLASFICAELAVPSGEPVRGCDNCVTSCSKLQEKAGLAGEATLAWSAHGKMDTDLSLSKTRHKLSSLLSYLHSETVLSCQLKTQSVE